MDTQQEHVHGRKDGWETPALTRYGSVEELTAQDKNFQADDGFTVEGDSIGS